MEEYLNLQNYGIIMGFASGIKLFIASHKNIDKHNLAVMLNEINENKKPVFDTKTLIFDDKDDEMVNKYSKLYTNYTLPLIKPILWKNTIPEFFNELYIYRFECLKPLKSEKHITKVIRRKSLDILRRTDLDAHLKNLTGIDSKDFNLEKSTLAKFDDENDKNISIVNMKKNLKESDLSIEDEDNVDELNNNDMYDKSIIYDDKQITDPNRLAIDDKCNGQAYKNAKKVTSAISVKMPYKSKKDIDNLKKIKSTMKLGLNETRLKRDAVSLTQNKDNGSNHKNVRLPVKDKSKLDITSKTSISDKKSLARETKNRLTSESKQLIKTEKTVSNNSIPMSQRSKNKKEETNDNSSKKSQQR